MGEVKKLISRTFSSYLEHPIFSSSPHPFLKKLLIKKTKLPPPYPFLRNKTINQTKENENMQKLTKKIEEIKKTPIKQKIDQRIQEFQSINKDSNDEIFEEMCFCLLTANFNAEKSIKIQNNIGQCFYTDSQETLTKKLKKHGHRFPNKRAEYIHESKKCKNKLTQIINFHDQNAIREWIVNNVKGLGYKEASHFLRNIGFQDYAIIDFHILDLLEKYDIIKKPKTLSKKKYLEIEKTLKKIAEKTNLTLAELDLYLWYMETGKILK